MAPYEQIAQLFSSDGAQGDRLGCAAAADGDTVVIGALGDDNAGGANAGAVYVFIRSGSAWVEQQKLLASDGAADDLFGCAVGVHGDTIIVGARNDGNVGGLNAGAAYVFTRLGSVWSQQQKLLASDGAAGDCFGNSVSVSADSAIVGSPNDNNALGVDAGSAYVFTRAAGVWTEQQKLLAGDGAASDVFGSGVAIDGDTVAVGAPLDTWSGKTNAGSVYVFTRAVGVWTPQQKITHFPASAYDWHGRDVSLSGDSIIAGARGAGTFAGVDAGKAYVFTRSAGVWSQQQDLQASDGAANEYFGTSVSISGDIAIVGADEHTVGVEAAAGAAYIFIRSGGVWTEVLAFNAADGTAMNQLGTAVAVGSTVLVAGAPGYYGFGAFQSMGTVYILGPPLPARAQLPGGYLDLFSSNAPAARIALINCHPEDEETGVKVGALLRGTIASLDNLALAATTKLYVSMDGAAEELVYDQAGGGFQAGWNGALSSVTIQASPGSGVNDELVYVIHRTTAFLSKTIVTVRAEAETV